MQYLSDEEIVKDFEKFLRHESMRAYADYDKVVSLVQEYVNQDASSKEDTDATAEKLSKVTKLKYD